MTRGGSDLPLRVGDMVLVRKLDYATGHVLISWPGTLVHVIDDLVVVRAAFASMSGNPVFVDGVPFSRGDIFTEFYFLDRWYNVFHIADAVGRRKGWYCNVTLPATLDDEGVTFVDLALDLFAHPDGRFTVLDEDEFAASENVYSPEHAAQARQAIAELTELAADGALPTPDDVR